MSEERQMYELLKQGQQREDLTLRVPADDPRHPVVERLLTLNMLETIAAMYSGKVVKLTAQGLRAISQADAAGVQVIEWAQQSRPIHFQQTNYGTANTQIGDRNVMHVHPAPDQGQLLQQLVELRALVHTLPEAEQDEAKNALDQTEKAVKSGALDKVKNYGPVILGLGLQTVEFATKAKEFFDGIRL